MKTALCTTVQGKKKKKAPTSPEFLHLIITKLNLRFIQAPDVKTSGSASPELASGPHMCQTSACGWAARGRAHAAGGRFHGTPLGGGASLENVSPPQGCAWLPAPTPRPAEAGLGLPDPWGSTARVGGQPQGGAGDCFVPQTLVLPEQGPSLGRRRPRAVGPVSAT